MANQTANLGLTLPIGTEKVSRQVINTNFDLIDAEAGRTRTNFAGEYSDTGTYAVGDYCLYQGNLYRCTTAINSGEAWNSAHWSQVSAGDELASANEAIANITPSIIGRNENNSHQWILMKLGNLYHLHYERLGTVANGTKVHTINSSYAPSSDVNAYDFYQQTSGYAAVRLTVKSSGEIYMNAVTHNENVAGVFDVFWTKS